MAKVPTRSRPAKPRPAQSNPAAPPAAARKPASPIHPFDLAHNLDTSGLIAAGHLLTGHPNDAHVTAYYGVAPSILRSLIGHWLATSPPHPIQRYTFLDVGAGKGRAVFVASELPFRKVIGIELNPDLAAIARHNLDSWLASHAADPTAPPIAPLRLLQQDALSFNLPPGPSVAFLFHPFEAPVLKLLLRRIETQLAGRARPAFDLLYVNAECASVLDRHPAFTRLFFGLVAMSPDDHHADLAAIAAQKQYGSTGNEECAIYRYTGRRPSSP